MTIVNVELSEDLKSYKNLNQESANNVSDLRKVNILIGPNNSGKSRFMRALFWGHHLSRITGGKLSSFQNSFITLYDLMINNSLNTVETLTLAHLKLILNGFEVEFTSNTYKPHESDLKQFPFRINSITKLEDKDGNQFIQTRTFINE